MSGNEDKKALSQEEIQELGEKYYRGELKDLAHLRGIKCRHETTVDEAEYRGRVEF